MPLFKNHNLIDENDILNFVTNKVPENKNLDYKLILKISGSEDKKEFLYDISSLANSEGGIIIYGISEQKDDKGQNTGTPSKIEGIEIENLDKLKLSIEQLINSSIEPNISDVVIKHFIVDKKNILMIGIPKQWGLPRMVTYSSSNKFYKRRNTGKYLLDVFELNQLFMNNSELAKDATKFRDNRIIDVRNHKFLPNLFTKFSTFIHIIPLTFFQTNQIPLTDIRKIEQLRLFLKPIDSNGYDFRYNFEGYLLYNREGSSVTAYSQFFRNGIIEAYTALLHKENSIEKYNNFEASYFESCTIDYINDAFKTYMLFNISPPFLIYISIFHLENTLLDTRLRGNRKAITKNELILPSIVINDFNAKIDVELKGIFDIIWQTGGYPCSPNYDQNNNRKKL